MFLFYLLLFIISIGIIQKKYNTLFVPATIMAVTWCIFPAIASMGPLGLYEISLKTHLIILVSYFSYMSTTLFVPNTSYNFESGLGTAQSQNSHEVKYKIIIIGNVLVCIWLLSVLGDAWAIIEDKGFVYLRVYYEQILSESTVVNILYNWFAKTFVVSSCVIFCIDILNGKGHKRSKLTVGILVLVNVVLDTIIFAARATLVKMIIYLFFAFFFCKNRKFTKKQVFWVVLLVALLMVFVVFMTGERMEDTSYADFSFFDSITMYYVAPFALLDHYIRNPAFSLLGVDNLLYGTGTFGAVYNIFRSALYVLGIAEYNGSDYILQLVTQHGVRVGTRVTINSACTAGYVFLRDFGVVGVVLGFVMMASITEFYRISYKKNPSVRNGALYIVMLYVVFRLSMSYDFLSPGTFFTIFFVYLCTRKKAIPKE